MPGGHRLSPGLRVHASARPPRSRRGSRRPGRVATAAPHHGIRTVAVEPENGRTLNAATKAGHLVDVTVDSIVADSLGARRTSPMRQPGGAGRSAPQVGVASIGAPRAAGTVHRAWDGAQPRRPGTLYQRVRCSPRARRSRVRTASAPGQRRGSPLARRRRCCCRSGQSRCRAGRRTPRSSRPGGARAWRVAAPPPERVAPRRAAVARSSRAPTSARGAGRQRGRQGLSRACLPACRASRLVSDAASLVCGFYRSLTTCRMPRSQPGVGFPKPLPAGLGSSSV